MEYTTKLTYISPDGEINEEPSQTIEGEYFEMKDILAEALKGSPLEARKVSYFAPEDITKINSLFRNSLDLTDLDALKANTTYMNKKVNEAIKQRDLEAQQLQEQVAENFETQTTNQDP